MTLEELKIILSLETTKLDNELNKAKTNVNQSVQQINNSLNDIGKNEIREVNDILKVDEGKIKKKGTKAADALAQGLSAGLAQGITVDGIKGIKESLNIEKQNMADALASVKSYSDILSDVNTKLEKARSELNILSDAMSLASHEVQLYNNETGEAVSEFSILKQRYADTYEYALKLDKAASHYTELVKDATIKGLKSAVNVGELKKEQQAQEAINKSSKQEQIVQANIERIIGRKLGLTRQYVTAILAATKAQLQEKGFSGIMEGLKGTLKDVLSLAGAVFKALPTSLKVVGIAAAAVAIKIAKIKLAIKAIKTVGKVIGSAAKAMFKLSGLGPLFKTVGAAIKKVGTTIKDALTKPLTDALSDFGSTISNMITKTGSVQSALSSLKGSFLTAMQPVLNVVIPALVKLINILAQACNWIAKLGAMLSGTTLGALKSDAQASYQLAEGMDAAGAAAENANNTMGIDELNVISQDSGGGGSSADSIIPDFSGVEGSAFTSFADSFNNLLDNLISGLPTMGSMLETAAQGINSFFGNLYEGLTDEDVVSKVKELAGGIATNLNKFIKDTDWKQIGKTFGAGVNRIFDFAYTFLTTFDFKAWAKSITDSINGFIEEVDWKRIGETISAFIKSTLEFSISFFRNIDWQALGEAIGDLLKGIDWLGIIGDLFVLLWEVTKGATLLLWGLIKSLIIEPLGELFASIGEWFVSLWESICEIAQNIASWFNENVIQPVAQFFVDLWEGIKAIWNAVATWFNDNVIQPLVNFFKPIIEVIGKIFEGLWMIIRAVWEVVSTWFNENVIQPIVEFFRPIIEAIGGFFKQLWDDIVVIWETVSGWFDEHVIQPVVSFFKTLWESILGFFKSLWDDIKKIWETVSNWFQKNVIDPVRLAFEAVCKAVGKFFSDLWDGIKKGVVTAFNAVISGIESAINFIVHALNFFIEGFNSIVQWAADILGEDWSGLTLIADVQLGRIPELAKGGILNAGQLFIANEAGPELVGRYGNQSAVMNNDQIVSAVSTGVYNAVVSAMSQGNQAVNVYLDGRQIESTVRQTNQSYGAVIASGGLLNYGFA